MTVEVETQEVQAAETPEAEKTRSFTLPSGKKVVLSDGTGYHLMKAMRISKDPSEVTFALMAQLITIDGKPVVFEELLGLGLKDIMALQQEFNSDFLS